MLDLAFIYFNRVNVLLLYTNKIEFSKSNLELSFYDKITQLSILNDV